MSLNNSFLKESIIQKKRIHCLECSKTPLIYLQYIDNEPIICYKCQEAHKGKIPLSKFLENLQNMKNEIICSRCGQLLEESCYCCLNCLWITCEKCKNIHDKEKNHNSLESYVESEFLCSYHYTSFFAYCLKCKKNICTYCKSHSDHEKFIFFDNFFQKTQLEKFTFLINNAKKFINRLNEIQIQMENFYKKQILICDKIFNSFKKINEEEIKLCEILFDNYLYRYETHTITYPVIKNIENIFRFKYENLNLNYSINSITSEKILNYFNNIGNSILQEYGHLKEFEGIAITKNLNEKANLESENKKNSLEIDNNKENKERENNYSYQEKDNMINSKTNYEKNFQKNYEEKSDKREIDKKKCEKENDKKSFGRENNKIQFERNFPKKDFDEKERNIEKKSNITTLERQKNLQKQNVMDLNIINFERKNKEKGFEHKESNNIISVKKDNNKIIFKMEKNKLCLENNNNCKKDNHKKYETNVNENNKFKNKNNQIDNNNIDIKNEKNKIPIKEKRNENNLKKENESKNLEQKNNNEKQKEIKKIFNQDKIKGTLNKEIKNNFINQLASISRISKINENNFSKTQDDESTIYLENCLKIMSFEKKDSKKYSNFENSTITEYSNSNIEDLNNKQINNSQKTEKIKISKELNQKTLLFEEGKIQSNSSLLIQSVSDIETQVLSSELNKSSTKNTISTSESRIQNRDISEEYLLKKYNELIQKIPPLDYNLKLETRFLKESKNDRYYGEISGKKKFGRGIWYVDGGLYEGYFYNDEANGYGKYTNTNCDVFQGEWENSKKKKGKEIFCNGEIFEGEYKNDHFYFGTFKNFNGDIYEGQFKNNKKNGKGVLIVKQNDKETIYEGEWNDGELNGSCIIKYSSGNIDEVYYENGILSKTKKKFNIYTNNWAEIN